MWGPILVCAGTMGSFGNGGKSERKEVIIVLIDPDDDNSRRRSEKRYLKKDRKLVKIGPQYCPIHHRNYHVRTGKSNDSSVRSNQ